MLAAFVALLVYNANFRVIAQGDSLPARFLPLAVWGEGTLYFDDLHEVTRSGPAPGRPRRWSR